MRGARRYWLVDKAGGWRCVGGEPDYYRRSEAIGKGATTQLQDREPDGVIGLHGIHTAAS